METQGHEAIADSPRHLATPSPRRSFALSSRLSFSIDLYGNMMYTCHVSAGQDLTRWDNTT